MDHHQKANMPFKGILWRMQCCKPSGWASIADMKANTITDTNMYELVGGSTLKEKTHLQRTHGTFGRCLRRWYGGSTLFFIYIHHSAISRRLSNLMDMLGCQATFLPSADNSYIMLHYINVIALCYANVTVTLSYYIKSCYTLLMYYGLLAFWY